MRISIPFVALAALFLFSSAAEADTSFTVEPIVAITKKKSDPSIDGTFTRTFEKSPFGLSGFWWVTGGFAEAYAGPTYAPKPWLTIGTGVGLEQNARFTNPQGRYAINFNATSLREFAKTEITGSLEMNTATFSGDVSGVWYDVLATLTMHPNFTFGARGRRFIGFGPFVQMNIPELHTKMWMFLGVVDAERRLDTFKTFAGVTGLTFDL